MAWSGLAGGSDPSFTCSRARIHTSRHIYGRKARLLNLNIIGWLLWECRWHRAPGFQGPFCLPVQDEKKPSRFSPCHEKVTRRDKDLASPDGEQTVGDSALEIFLFFFLSSIDERGRWGDKMSAINNPTCRVPLDRCLPVLVKHMYREFPYNHRCFTLAGVNSCLHKYRLRESRWSTCKPGWSLWQSPRQRRYFVENNIA